VLRWTLTGLDPPLVALLPLQLLHALTYAASHLGAMYWLANRVPEGQQGTAQALLNTFTAGVAMSGAMLLAGALYAEFGGASYLSMSGLAAVGVLAAVTLRKESAGKAIVRSG
jgi:PPP family 3-phenylpropionic acid transporter